MNRYYFYIYLVSIVIFFAIYAVLKCGYKINTFDFLLFHDETNKGLLNTIMYLLFHFIFYFGFGILFGFEILYEMVLKTIMMEVLLVMSKNCSFTNFEGMESAVKSIIIGLLSYFIGAIVLVGIRRYWYKIK